MSVLVLPYPPVEIGRRQVSAHWCVTRDGDPQAMALHRRHYSCKDPLRIRRTFVGNGEKLILISTDGSALFAWLRQRNRLDGREGVVCTIFRNEGTERSSVLIREAVRLAWERWPGETLFTFVDEQATARRRGQRHTPGWCFQVAGFQLLEERTREHRLRVLELRPGDTPY